MKKLRRLLIVLSILVLLALGVWWGNNCIQTDVYSFASPGLPEAFEGFRVVHLSDLHGRQFGPDGAKLLAAVEAAKPDLIALTGDFVDAHSDVSDVVPLVEGLVELAPVYYVTGNHEWGSGQARLMVQTLRALGVHCLENEFEAIERGGQRILIAGVHDPNGFADQKTPAQLSAELHAAYDNPWWLLLAHRNSLFNGGYCRLGASLTLCGHAHGGIWRLPFTDGLIDSDLRFLPSFTAGFYQCTDGGHTPSWVFVSRGLGNSPRVILRLFNHPQVAVIELKASN